MGGAGTANMAAVLVAESATLYWLGTGHKLHGRPPTDPTYLLIELVSLLVYLWLVAALVLRLQALRAGRTTSLRDDLAAASKRWSTLLLAYFAAVLLLLVGLLALILPGIYLAVCLVPLVPVVVLEPQSPIAAIRRCVQLVRPLWVKVFASVLIAALIIMVCLFTLGLVSSLALVAVSGGNGQIANALGTAVLMAAMAAAQIFLFSLSLTIYSAASSSA